MEPVTPGTDVPPRGHWAKYVAAVEPPHALAVRNAMTPRAISVATANLDLVARRTNADSSRSEVFTLSSLSLLWPWLRRPNIRRGVDISSG